MRLPPVNLNKRVKEQWYQKHFPGRLLVTREGRDLSKQANETVNELMSL